MRPEPDRPFGQAGRSQPPLASIRLLRGKVETWDDYPFCVPAVKNLESLSVSHRVCFFVGENGSGKSTVLEAIAEKFGFGAEGGTRHMTHLAERDAAVGVLSRALQLSWRRKPSGGFFLRAESFFNVACYIDELLEGDQRMRRYYGDKLLHEQSHGESFLALFQNRFGEDGLYLLDEPESALSPQRQLSFLLVLHDLVAGSPDVQVIIATHSPIILAYPHAQIFSFDGDCIDEVQYQETDIYQLYSGFLARPQLYLRRLLWQPDP